jgi:hypothetical protein
VTETNKMAQSSTRLAYSPPAFAGTIGVSRADITPPVGIYARNWGAATHDAAEGIHRPLTATVLTLQSHNNELPLVLAALDLGWWRGREDEWILRNAIIEEFGLDTARVMICLSHTHAGPSICRADSNKPGGDLVAGYLQHLQHALLRATREALQSSQPATLSWHYGKSTLATNRDLRDPQANRVICGWNHNHHADDTLLVGCVKDGNSQTLATIVNYACHPTTLAWQNRLISPDYIGALRETVETQTNAPCLFLLGASGELAPREQYIDDAAVADAHGHQLGFAVLSALADMLPPQTAFEYSHVVESGAPLAVWQRVPTEVDTTLAARCVDVQLPLKDWPLAAEIEAELRTTSDRALGERLRRKLIIRRAVGDGSSAAVPAYIWRVGGAFFVGHPNEAYSLLQTELRRAFPEYAVAVMNVVNGWSGYLPPQELYDEDLYAVWQTPFERGSLEQLIETCRRVLESMA